MQFDQKNKFSPSPGPTFHGKWQPGYVEANRRIYDFELVYFAQGVTEVITPEGVFDCQAGSVLIIPPDLVHCSVALDEVERWCIHFDWFSDCRGPRTASDVFVYTGSEKKFDPSLCAAAPGGLAMPLALWGDPALLPLIRSYFAAQKNGANPLIRQGLLSQILGVALEEENGIARSRSMNRLALAAKNKVDEKCRDFTLTVAQIAREMHVSANHLSRLFREQFNCSITQYLIRQRMEIIRGMLYDYTLSIAEIAERCGFSNSNYFCRFFRKQTGISPDAFRKRKN